MSDPDGSASAGQTSAHGQASTGQVPDVGGDVSAAMSTSWGPRQAYDWVTQSVFRKVAHDIVGSAGVTKGALVEIERSLGAPTNEQQAALFAMARRGIARLERLARRLRLSALAESTELSATLRPLDLREVLVEAVSEAAELDSRRTIQLERVLPKVPLTVNADPELLRVAFAEVVSNAQRFARKLVRVETHADGDRVEVIVEDDGPGFMADFSEQLQPRLRPREGQRGAGLSFACVLAIVETHHGSFLIEPRSGGAAGARVRMTFARIT